MRLTPRNLEVLRALADGQDTAGWTPTVRELCELLAVSSTSSVQRHIERLVALGLIETRYERRRITALGRSALRKAELTA